MFIIVLVIKDGEFLYYYYFYLYLGHHTFIFFILFLWVLTFSPCYFQFVLITGFLNNVGFYSTPSPYNGTHIISFSNFVHIPKKWNFLPATLALPLACKFRSKGAPRKDYRAEELVWLERRNYGPCPVVLESLPCFGVGEVGDVTWRGRGHL